MSSEKRTIKFGVDDRLFVNSDGCPNEIAFSRWQPVPRVKELFLGVIQAVEPGYEIGQTMPRDYSFPCIFLGLHR